MDIKKIFSDSKDRIDFISYIQGCGGDYINILISNHTENYLSCTGYSKNKNNRWDTDSLTSEIKLIIFEEECGELEINEGDDIANRMSWSVEDYVKWSKDNSRTVCSIHLPPKNFNKIFPESKKYFIGVDPDDAYWSKYILDVMFMKNFLEVIEDEASVDSWGRCDGIDLNIVNELKHLAVNGGIYCGLIWYIRDRGLTAPIEEMNTVDFLKNNITSFGADGIKEKTKYCLDVGFEYISIKDVIETDIIHKKFGVDSDIFNTKINEWHKENLKMLSHYGIF